MNFVNYSKQQTTEGRYINGLTESEYATIEGLAEDSLEVSAYAKGLLDIAYNEDWHHPIFSTPASADFYQVPNDENPEKSQLGNAIPNPARESVRLEVSITKKDADLNPRLLIYSMSGKRVYQKDLQAGKNHLLINTQAWQSGVYFYSLERGHQALETKKLVILK